MLELILAEGAIQSKEFHNAEPVASVGEVSMKTWRYLSLGNGGGRAFLKFSGKM